MSDLASRVQKLESREITAAALWRAADDQWDAAHPEKMIGAMHELSERAERLARAGRVDLERVAKTASLLERYYAAIYAPPSAAKALDNG